MAGLAIFDAAVGKGKHNKPALRSIGIAFYVEDHIVSTMLTA
jgi:hypothetical protein